MNRLANLMMVAFLAMGMSACNDDPAAPSAGGPRASGTPTGNPSKGGCEVTFAGTHYCIDATGSGWDAETLQAMCESMPGTTNFTLVQCAGSQYGTCVLAPGQDVEQVYNFYDGYNSAAAQSVCASMQGQYYAN